MFDTAEYLHALLSSQANSNWPLEQAAQKVCDCSDTGESLIDHLLAEHLSTDDSNVILGNLVDKGAALPPAILPDGSRCSLAASTMDSAYGMAMLVFEVQQGQEYSYFKIEGWYSEYDGPDLESAYMAQVTPTPEVSYAWDRL